MPEFLASIVPAYLQDSWASLSPTVQFVTAATTKILLS